MEYLGEEDKTRSAIDDDDGWLHSGDISSIVWIVMVSEDSVMVMVSVS